MMRTGLDENMCGSLSDMENTLEYTNRLRFEMNQTKVLSIFH